MSSNKPCDHLVISMSPAMNIPPSELFGWSQLVTVAPLHMLHHALMLFMQVINLSLYLHTLFGEGAFCITNLICNFWKPKCRQRLNKKGASASCTFSVAVNNLTLHILPTPRFGGK